MDLLKSIFSTSKLVRAAERRDGWKVYELLRTGYNDQKDKNRALKAALRKGDTNIAKTLRIYGAFLPQKKISKPRTAGVPDLGRAPEQRKAASSTEGTETSKGPSRAPHGPAFPSRHLPNFPLNPMRGPARGEPINDELLADAMTVVLCIYEEFVVWKRDIVKKDWPSYADKELEALLMACGAMKPNVPSGIDHHVDVAQVCSLARKYLRQISSDADAFQEFREAHLTLLGLTIDFCNTIGYGGLVQTTLDWYE